VPLNVSGDTIVLVANPVANGRRPGRDHDQRPIRAGEVVNVTVRFAPLFATGLTVTPSSGTCGRTSATATPPR
jgi:hypothetical protein